MRNVEKDSFERAVDLAPPGRALEIGAYNLEKSVRGVLEKKGFEYANLDIEASDVPDTTIGDICAERFDDVGFDPERFSLIYTSDVFEHLKKPWIAAKNIINLLQPGGVVLVWTVWSWRHHPVPVDYWRFSADCLKYLFDDLECIEGDFDTSERRKDIRGFWENKLDHVPVDDLGGWRENWRVYFMGRKSA